MAGITTPDSIIDRVRDLLRAYLATEVALVDTRNNALGTGTDNDFTTPTIASTDIVSYTGRSIEGRPIRVIVMDEGDWSDSSAFQLSGQDSGEQLSGTTEPTSTLPRLQREMRFSILIITADNGSTMRTTAGNNSPEAARRVCNRVGEAVNVVMQRYPKLSIPSTSTAGLPTVSVKRVSDRRAGELEGDETLIYRRQITYRAETIESRA